MNRVTVREVVKALFIFVAIVLSQICPSQAQQANVVNRGTVELETTGSDGISVRIAEDLARLFNDGATRRLIPVVGAGSLQNITDLRFLRGIDLAIVQTDVLNYARDQNLVPALESSVTYVTKLYNEEFHLLARPEIKNLADLNGRKVNVDVVGSGTTITAERLFSMLKISVTAVHDTPQVALSKLRNGEIAALAFVAAKPAPLFQQITAEDGLHLIAVPVDKINDPVYGPTQLTAADYPRLVQANAPVDTIEVGSMIVAADLHQLPERANSVSAFVKFFFANFPSLSTPGYHPKWNEVNLAADVEGWQRYEPARQWLARNPQIAGVQDPDNLRTMFSRFVDERRQALGGAPMSDVDKDALFRQFQTWKGGSAH
jgi:TRAP transporter TAXI family solute receptor